MGNAHCMGAGVFSEWNKFELLKLFFELQIDEGFLRSSNINWHNFNAVFITKAWVNHGVKFFKILTFFLQLYNFFTIV